ncbi:MAG: hypothetical protein RIR79_1375 [Pseudomonadota bacterium]|jgi:nucleoside-diphosphate-sugar epimerase
MGIEKKIEQKIVIGVLGGRSLVGNVLIPMLVQAGYRVVAFSRKNQPQPTEQPTEQSTEQPTVQGVEWRHLSDNPSSTRLVPVQDRIDWWICLAPIWVLPTYYPLLAAHGTRRIVVLSSTSRFTKVNSTVSSDAIVVDQLVQGEDKLQAWAANVGAEWVVLRPTLIYGNGHDKNLTEIARFIQRFGFFPFIGKGKGLRQPIRTEDVAQACVSALCRTTIANRAYNIAGQEVLTYRDMVTRIFHTLKCKPRFLSIPRSLFQLALLVVRILPRYRSWSIAMADRMNKDMTFDWTEAKNDLGFSPRPFQFSPHDLPHDLPHG